MFAITMRYAVAASMLVVMTTMLFVSNTPTPLKADALPFSKVLQELRGLSTLEFRLVKKGEASQIFVRAPGLVRKEKSATHYEIAAGSRLWRIDESSNSVESTDSPWFHDSSTQVDLLQLLGLDVTDPSALLRSRPVELGFSRQLPEITDVAPVGSVVQSDKPVSRHDDARCFIYRVQLPSKTGPIDVEAYVKQADHKLIGIAAWPVGKNRSGGPPLAEIRLIAMNNRVEDEKFEIPDSLTEDGRIGGVSQLQGIVVLRPMLAKRWSPISPQTLVRTGDWIRTELRGANATKITLASDVELTLGPGTLLECISPSKARLHSGIVQVAMIKGSGPKEAKSDARNAEENSSKPLVKKIDEFTLLAPHEGSLAFKWGDQKLVRVDREEHLVDVPQIPVWLAGFEGTSNQESLGSLIVNLPDGRNEPLTVGYHKVSVEIRDQIARTTIEESFVNRTQSRLEGIFHFPLPRDASISGFGMWIGNDLVEADVVEKQRAREIYETILRERRDPGLLEWTSGNLFKARVFPIEPQSEKRIKIVYTQVLPMRGNRYRYTYGLRSDLLRTNPVRELALSVKVNSALGLKTLHCPTHATRTQLAKHSGQVEFSAQEYIPNRDFEVVCEVEREQSDVVVVPHRRGEDGYFLVQITHPFYPAATGDGQRNDLIADSKPVNLVLLCDTSGSMDSEKRSKQTEFVQTVLTSLGPDDRFQVAACDVGTEWFNESPMAPTEENLAAVARFLRDRRSLGWTNLDQAFANVLKKAPTGSQVVYIGDGIVSAGDPDPAAFAKRLDHMVGDFRQPADSSTAKPSGDSKSITLHAVSVGNTYESVGLEAIASIGRGSVRSIGGEQLPQQVARDLLREIVEPGLRDVSVEFRGLKVAAVYPGRLPNVAAGTQLILVGRYLPKSDSSDQNGEVIVTGLHGTERVKYSARISLKDAETGNSFIPRLWGRAHLDYLLAQGHSSAIHDEIIRLSEEFHIITPYTSLLVLETEADRERFGVKRHYEMRDGERFFTAGRDDANYELLQQQMKRAGDWRIGMRNRVLQSLTSFGRNPQLLQEWVQRFRGRNQFDLPPLSQSRTAGIPGGMPGYFGSNLLGDDPLIEDRTRFDFLDEFSAIDNRLRGVSRDTSARWGDISLDSKRPMGPELWAFQAESLSVGVSRNLGESDGDSVGRDDYDSEHFIGDERGSNPSPENSESRFSDFTLGRKVKFKDRMEFGVDKSIADFDDKKMKYEFFMSGGGSVSRPYWNRSSNSAYTEWLNALFPGLSSPKPSDSPVMKDPESWSPEAIAVSQSLLRSEALSKIDGGIELRRQVDYLDPRWNRSSGRRMDLTLYSPESWLTRTINPDDQTLVQFSNSKERGVYSLSFMLGRTRRAVATDLKPPPLGLEDFSQNSLRDIYSAFTARVEAAGENLANLRLTSPDDTTEIRFAIDTKRHVIVKRSVFNEGKLNSSTVFDDFVEVAGSWWATRIVHNDDQGSPTSDTRMAVTALAKDQYQEKMTVQLAARNSVQFLELPLASLQVARQKVADGSASFSDRVRMILHLVERQQWDEMWKHVDAIESMAADKPGVRWIRTLLLTTIRRNEEALSRLTEEARRLLPAATQDEVFLAEFLLQRATSLGGVNEIDKLHQLLKPVYSRAFNERLPRFRSLRTEPNEVDQRASDEVQRQILQRWNDRELSNLEAMGRNEESLAGYREAAEKCYWEQDRQQRYAQRLAAAGQYREAHAWLRQALLRPELRASDDEFLRNSVADLYRQQADWDGLLKWTTEWIAKNPESISYSSPYAQHLSALIFNDQLDAAYSLADEWLKGARVEGKMSVVERAHFEAALNFANGSAYQLNFQRMDERWYERLAATARVLFRNPNDFDLVPRCVSNHEFAQTDESDRLRGEWLTLLQSEVATLKPAQIGLLVGWSLSGRMELITAVNGRKQLDSSEVPNEIWLAIATSLKQRWRESRDKKQTAQLSETLVNILTNRFSETELLPFLRERILTADSDHKPQYLNSLFERLLVTSWTDEIEQEAFSVWLRLSDEAPPAQRLVDQIPALLRMVDAMLANRIAAAERKLNDLGEQNKLTRKEIANQKAEIRKLARQGLANRLHEIASREKRDAKVDSKTALSLFNWMSMEQFWLELRNGQKTDEIEVECWKILGEAPHVPMAKHADETGDEISEETSLALDTDQILAFFDAQLRMRAFGTVMSLATRKQAAQASIDRVMKYIDSEIAKEIEPDKTDGTSPNRVNSSFWRGMKFRFLVALDRAADLEKELRAWIRADVSTGPWRQALARLMAERGKLDEAISLFEACKRDKLLSAADYRNLADWYLVQNHRGEYERSRIEAYQQMPERNLEQMIYQASNRWQQPNPPSQGELDEETLFIFQALLRKSSHPEYYLWQLRTIYAASRDYRLLQMLPDAILGRSPEQVYPFLQTLQSNVLAELRNEATADEILGRVALLRKGDRTTTDLRALDLLEALIERKSAEILNQPGSHIQSCLSAMQRAFQREWSEGEPGLMAKFLVSLGGLPNENLREEQLRELRLLRSHVKENSRDHLAITSQLCHLLFWNYTRYNEALQDMEAEVRSYLQVNDGIWPFVDNEDLASYVQMLQGANRHLAAETVLKDRISRPDNDSQSQWLNQQLTSLYNHALEHDGAVSIGTGRANLFQPIIDRSLKVLESAGDENIRYALIAGLNTTFDIAHRHKLPPTEVVLKELVFETLPKVFRRQSSQYRNTATALLHSVRTILSPRDSLLFVVERMEQWPQRLEVQHDSSWNALGSELAARRSEAGSTDLDPRVLNLAVNRLQSDLRYGAGAHQAIFHHGYQYFWREKTQDFARGAEEILSERRTSGRRASSVATYLRQGLGLFPRSVEVMLMAHKKGLLDEATQMTLVTWLHQENRYAEMIPLLEPLIASRPENMTYRTELMVAYAASQRPEQLNELIDDTEKVFHKGGRWNEGNIAQFGRGCQGASQWEQAKRLFTEAIVLHQRSLPGSGLNDNLLSDYYQQLARLEAKLNHTDAAVTATSAAIVCWGARHQQRQIALNTLKEILAASTNLSAYVEHLAAESEKTGQYSPILLKAIGDTYRQRNDLGNAIVQYQLAAELQPTDKEIHHSLIACYDASNQPELATTQLIKLIDLQQHDLSLYQQLANRLKDDPAEAERAATSIVESAPNEAESHAAMAEFRQNHNRWSEAIPHWEQVARLRKLEPTGLLRLANAQIHEKQWEGAKTSLDQLSRTQWPARFNQVASEIQLLKRQIPKQ